MSDAELHREANDNYFGHPWFAHGDDDDVCDDYQEDPDIRTLAGDPACRHCGFSERRHA